jgi:hypothetical protein
MLRRSSGPGVEGTTDYPSLAPSVVTLAINDAAILLTARWLERRQERRQDAPAS